jgi:TrmH RNA methyltransferase
MTVPRPPRPRSPRPSSAPPRPPPAPTGAIAPTEKVFGLRAGLATFAVRRDDITAVTFAAELRPQLGELLRWAAARRLPCVEASPEGLTRAAESPQHEGLCVTTRPRRWLPAAALADLLAQGRGVGVALDRVRNPYNIGAILRTAAFFGVDAALLGAPAPHPALPADAVRVAEGGVEHLALSRTTDLAETLHRLRGRGVRVIGADGGSPTRAVGFAFARPCVLVLGHEREGLSERVRAQCDAVVSIAGSGAVESLNVAVAAGVLIGEMLRPR